MTPQREKLILRPTRDTPSKSLHDSPITPRSRPAAPDSQPARQPTQTATATTRDRSSRSNPTGSASATPPPTAPNDPATPDADSPAIRPRPRSHRIANQPIVPRNHRATNHMTARHQSRLNLPRLNPVAPHLHLTVATTDILQHPIRPPTNQISRPVQTTPAAAITIRDKTRRRPTATTQITPSQTNPAQIQLPNNPTRNQLKTTVQNVPNHPRDRTPIDTLRGRPVVTARSCWCIVASVGP